MAKLALLDYDYDGIDVGVGIDNFLVDSVDDSVDLMTFYSFCVCICLVCVYACMSVFLYVCMCISVFIKKSILFYKIEKRIKKIIKIIKIQIIKIIIQIMRTIYLVFRNIGMCGKSQ